MHIQGQIEVPQFAGEIGAQLLDGLPQPRVSLALASGQFGRGIQLDRANAYLRRHHTEAELAGSFKTEPFKHESSLTGQTLWRADFDQHVRPAIDEVIARGDSFTRFQIMEPALPWQGFDFLLLYTGKTFAGLDRPRPFPHYVALFQREGSLRAFAALKEMGSYEDQVSVTLVHLNRTR